MFSLYLVNIKKNRSLNNIFNNCALLKYVDNKPAWFVLHHTFSTSNTTDFVDKAKNNNQTNNSSVNAVINNNTASPAFSDSNKKQLDTIVDVDKTVNFQVDGYKDIGSVKGKVPVSYSAGKLAIDPVNIQRGYKDIGSVKGKVPVSYSAGKRAIDPVNIQRGINKVSKVVAVVDDKIILNLEKISLSKDLKEIQAFELENESLRNFNQDLYDGLVFFSASSHNNSVIYSNSDFQQKTYLPYLDSINYIIKKYYKSLFPVLYKEACILYNDSLIEHINKTIFSLQKSDVSSLYKLDPVNVNSVLTAYGEELYESFHMLRVSYKSQTDMYNSLRAKIINDYHRDKKTPGKL